MSEFNITNSKIEQMSDSGNNYKLTTREGDNTVSSGSGPVIKSEGMGNTIKANAPDGFWASFVKRIKSVFGK